MRQILIISAAAMTLGACATTTTEAEPGTVAPEGGLCDAAPAQGLIGSKASAETGAQLLKTTGAAQLRWVPPRTAVTMDFRADRLTVSYDDDMVIERISCG